MPVAYGFTEEDIKSTHNGNERAWYRTSAEEYRPVSQEQVVMATEGEKSSMWNKEDLLHDQNIATFSAQSREELISRIKKTHKTTWIADKHDDSLDDYHKDSISPPSKSTLLPPIEIGRTSNIVRGDAGEHLEHGSSIERPRSALHAGDFRQRRDNDGQPDSPRPSAQHSRGDWTSTSPTTPWYAPQLRQPISTTARSTKVPPQESTSISFATNRDRASSYSALSSSFIFRPPTSPLAMQSNSNDFASEEFIHSRTHSPDKAYRRRTFSPSSLHMSNATTHNHESQAHRWPASASMRREHTVPYQAHQPRRSVTGPAHSQSYSDFPLSSSRTRRPSASGDASPLQHAPMVGRYEESILRGRMSTLPSKPLDFVAQIGVLGKGNCKTSLKCPPHITVPFPAVFYDYRQSHSHETSFVDGPSPYVGQVNLEAQLRSTASITTRALKRSQSPESDVGSNGEESGKNVRDGRTAAARQRRRQISKRAPRDSYRIPQQGQLQIVIKNPNKTAVKLFLVPYDLTGMESGQKTFVRQRSYSAGPILDVPLGARSDPSTEKSEAPLSNAGIPEDRPVLRYLVHLHICCPSRGRYYLYKSIRVVFANRVPDGKEKLRVEAQLPEPRYSAYKPESSVAGRLSNTSAVDARQYRHLSSPGPAKADDPFSSATGNGTHEEYIQLVPGPKPVFAFPRLPPQRALSRISSNRSSVPGDLMALDPHDSQISPKSVAPSRLQSPISWTSPPQSRRAMFDSPERTPSPSGRPAKEGLLALQFRDWAEQSKGQPPKSG